jgi:hypothetical protein
MWLGAKGEKFPAAHIHHLHAQTSSAGLCTVMMEDELFLPWTYVMQGTTKLMKYMLVMISTSVLPSWQKLNQYAPFTIPQCSSHGFTD